MQFRKNKSTVLFVIIFGTLLFRTATRSSAAPTRLGHHQIADESARLSSIYCRRVAKSRRRLVNHVNSRNARPTRTRGSRHRRRVRPNNAAEL